MMDKRLVDLFLPQPAYEHHGLKKIDNEMEIQLREQYGERYHHDPSFQGPLQKRSCTNFSYFVLFMCLITAWGAIGIYAFSKGDPKRLFSATDSEGNDCGKDEKVKYKPYLFFFDLTKCASPHTIEFGCATPQVCVEECPNETFVGPVRMKRNFYEARKMLICKYNFNKQMVLTPQDMEQSWKENNCAEWYLTSRSFLMRCLPKPNINVSEEEDFKYTNVTQEEVDDSILMIKLLFEVKEVSQKMVNDIQKFWPGLMFGFLFTTALSLTYIIIIRWVAKTLVWFTFAIFIIMMILCIVVTLMQLEELRKKTIESDEEKKDADRITRAINRSDNSESTIFVVVNKYVPLKIVWMVFLVAEVSFLFVMVLLMFTLCRRMPPAIALIQEARKSITKSKITLAFPVILFLMYILCIVWTVMMFLYLASSRNPIYKVIGLDNDSDCKCEKYKEGAACTQDEFERQCHSRSGDPCNKASCQFYKYESSPITWVMHAYNILALLWGLAVISSFGELVLAGVFSTWFWTFNKKNLTCFILGNSIWRTIRYHTGTLTKAAPILCMCRCTCVTMEYVNTKLRRVDNVVTKCIKFFCLFFCLEKFIKYINSNAYVIVAVHGKDFCSAALMAFNLLMRNTMRVFVVTQVTSFIIILGKLMVMSVIITTSFYMFMYEEKASNDDKKETTWYVGPILLLIIGSYFISSSFFGIYSMAVDTLFLCFLEDIERNDGSSKRPYFMSRKLMYILGKDDKEVMDDMDDVDVNKKVKENEKDKYNKNDQVINE